MKYIFYAMRPHQWVKGVFIFVPLVFGQKLADCNALSRTVWMFLSFSLAASAMYLVNDILDLEEDRHHPEKCSRPLVSGKITKAQALLSVGFLLAGAIPLAFFLNIKAGFVILAYLVLNFSYMRYLKHAVIIDVFCLGAFFYLRLYAGSVVSDVVLSKWIVMCTTLLALFLGFNKRKYDIEFSKNYRPVFTKYKSNFIDHMVMMIGASLVISYSLYVMDDATVTRFGTNHLFYSVPFVYYGLFRYVYLIDTKWYGGDPARILRGDYKMQLTIVLWLLVCVGVIYFGL